MFSLGGNQRIYYCAHPVNLRKSFDVQWFDLYQLQRCRTDRSILACLFQHSDPAACTFVRKFLQFAVFLNRQAAVPIFGQLLLPIISSFASHAVLPLFRFVEEHTTLSDSNPDGAGWALTKNFALLTSGMGVTGDIHFNQSSLFRTADLQQRGATFENWCEIDENEGAQSEDYAMGKIVRTGMICNKTMKAEFGALGILLHTPLRSNMKDDRSPEEVKALNNQRRLIETVIAQLTERFNAEKIRARDLWHLTVRISRKLLAHSINCCINQKYGNPLLQFERIFC